MEDRNEWMPYAASTKLYFGEYAQWFRQLLVLWFTLRWKVQYPLQIRVTKFATVGELIFVALTILLLVSSTSGNWMAFSMGGGDGDEDDDDDGDEEDRRRLDDDGVKGSGEATTFWMALAFLTATRNSPLTFLVGIPFERQLFWHKLFAYVSIDMGLYHGITSGDGDDRRRLTRRRLTTKTALPLPAGWHRRRLSASGLTSLKPCAASPSNFLPYALDPHIRGRCLHHPAPRAWFPSRCDCVARGCRHQSRRSCGHCHRHRCRSHCQHQLRHRYHTLDAKYFQTRVTPAEFATITTDVDSVLKARLRCGRPDLRAARFPIYMQG